MTKERQTHKEGKKKPALTLKEKRNAKKSLIIMKENTTSKKNISLLT